MSTYLSSILPANIPTLYPSQLAQLGIGPSPTSPLYSTSLSVIGAATLGSLSSTGVASFGSTLTVAGVSTFNGAISANAGASFSSTISVSGAAAFGSTLNVSGAVTFGNGATFSGSTIFNSAVNFNGPVTHGSNAVLGSNFTITGGVISGTSITGGTISGTPISGSTGSFTNLSVSGTTSVPTAPISDSSFAIANTSWVTSALSNAINGLQIKATATVATVVALPAYTVSGNVLTASSSGALVRDSYSCQPNDVLLVKNEAGSNAAYNGLYVVTQAGSASAPWVLTRHTDMSSANQFSGAFIPVGPAGATTQNSLWLCNPTGPVTIGTTLIPFTQLNGATNLVGGPGIAISGNTLSAAIAAITGGTISGAPISGATGSFTSLNASGAATLSSLAASGATTLGSTLTVAGASTFNNVAFFGANAVSGSNFSITGGLIGGTPISGSSGSFTTLSASGATNFTGSLSASGASTLGSLTVTGTSNFNGAASYGANAVSGSNFVVTGGSISGVSISGSTGSFTTLSASGAAVFGSTLSIAGAVTLASNFSVTGVGTFSNSSSNPSPLAGTTIQLVSNSATTGARLLVDSLGYYSHMTLRRANGTFAAPTATLSGDINGIIAAYGYGATGYASAGRGQMLFQAVENWTDTAQGTKIVLTTIPAGTVVQTTALTIGSDQSLSVAGALVVAGAATFSAGATFAGTSAVSVGGALSVTGATTLTGLLSANGGISSTSGSFSSTLSVAGASTFGGTVAFGANAVSGSNFSITGGSINGTLISGSSGAFTAISVSGAATFNGTTSHGSNVVNGSNFAISGGSINGTPIGATTPSTGSFTTLAASGAAALSSTLNVSALTTLAQTNVTTTLNVGTSNASFLAISGNQIYQTSATLYLQYSNSTNGVNICGQGGTALFGGAITVGGIATFNGAGGSVAINNNVVYAGSGTISLGGAGSGAVSVSLAGATTSVLGLLSVAGSTTLSSTLSVTGAITSGTLTSSSVSIDSGFYLILSGSNPLVNFASNSYLQYDRTNKAYNLIADSVNVGQFTKTSTTFGGTLNVTGATTLSSALSVTGAAALSSITMGSTAGTAGTANKIALFSTSYGLGISNSSFDHVSGANHTFYSGSTVVATMTSSGATFNGTLGVSGATTLNSTLYGAAGSFSGTLTLSAGDSGLALGSASAGGALRLTGSTGSGNAAIEIGSLTAASTPYIDFHTTGTGSDYDVRLLASGSNLGLTGNLSVTGSATATGFIVSGNGNNATVLQWTSANLAIRDNSSSGSTMYFDVGLGGTASNVFQWRSTSSVTTWMVLNSTGLGITNALSASGAVTSSTSISSPNFFATGGVGQFMANDRSGSGNNAVFYTAGGIGRLWNVSGGDHVAWGGGATNVTGTLGVSGAATFSGLINLPSGASIGSGIATGFFADGSNLAMRAYSGGAIFLQAISGSNNFAVLGPTQGVGGTFGTFLNGSLFVSGAGQATTTFDSTSATQGGVTRIHDTAGGVYNGGTLLFSAQQGVFAAIKAGITNGSNNTQGNLYLATRRNATDSTLTPTLTLDSGGNATVAGIVYNNGGQIVFPLSSGSNSGTTAGIAYNAYSGYGSLQVYGTKQGWAGLNVNDGAGHNLGTWMVGVGAYTNEGSYASSYAKCGFYDEINGNWIFSFDSSNNLTNGYVSAARIAAGTFRDNAVYTFQNQLNVNGNIFVQGNLYLNSNQLWANSGTLYLQYSNPSGGVSICQQGGTTTVYGPLNLGGMLYPTGGTQGSSGIRITNGSNTLDLFNDPGGHLESSYALFLNTNSGKDVYTGGTLRAAGNATFGGTASFGGTINTSGEVQSTSPNSFRSIYGNYGTFWRNDGGALYLMFTNSGDQYGNWNSLRPLTFDLPGGNGSFGQNLTVGGTLTANSSVTVAGTLTSNGAIVDNGTAKSLAATGYAKQPNGTIIQWTTATTNSSGAFTWTFPVAFPNACFGVVGTTNTTSGAIMHVQCSSISKSSSAIYTLYSNAAGGGGNYGTAGSIVVSLLAYGY